MARRKKRAQPASHRWRATTEQKAAMNTEARLGALRRDIEDRRPRHLSGTGLITEQSPAMLRFSTLVLGWRGLLPDEAAEGAAGGAGRRRDREPGRAGRDAGPVGRCLH